MDAWLEHFARANFQRAGDTAHDLKTPLNVAVLNLELLRMRARKLAGGEDDEKLLGYGSAIEGELRRLGRIFDAFFLLCIPPKDEGDPILLDACALCNEIGTAAGYAFTPNGTAKVRVHESRIRQALKLFFEGASKVLQAEGRRATISRDGSQLSITVEGRRTSDDVELTKIFKFYYTDPQGNPDLSFAAARLIAETYGGGLNAVDDRDKVILRFTLPLGDE